MPRKNKIELITQLKNNYKAFSKEGQSVEKSEYHIKHKTLIYKKDTPCKFDDTSLSFCAINQALFDYKEISSDTPIAFWNVEFSNCNFKNINFRKTNFWGCKFIRCNFEYCNFEYCDFSHTKVKFDQEMATVYDIRTQFRNCSLINVTYVNCNLECSIFENNNLFICKFLDSQMNRCFLDNNKYSMTSLINCNMQRSYLINLTIVDLEFRSNDNVNSINYIEKLYIDKPAPSNLKAFELKKNYYNISKMYYSFSQYLRSRNLDTNIEGQYNYLRHYYSMLSKDHWWNKIWDFISYITCGFGEKLGRFVSFVLVIIILPAILYMFTGIRVGNSIIQYPSIENICNSLNFAKVINDFGICLHFSFNILTFSSTSTATSYSISSSIISIIQTLLGILSTATFTSLVIKKLIK